MWTMTLGELISTLKRKDPDLSVSLDFSYFRPCGIHSYRGFYEQLALDYDETTDMTVGKLLAILEGAVGKTFYGYKGGNYTMWEETPVWVDKHNHASSTAIVDVDTVGGQIVLKTARVDV